MSVDPPAAHRTSILELLTLPSHLLRCFQPRFPYVIIPHTRPGAPLYGPNPQRRERNPSEPPPLTAFIKSPIL
jgi:hypothetical protein